LFGEAADMILFDARPPDGATRPGGNARAFDWPVLMGLDLPVPWILSGGLTSTNVATAIASSGATAVDVSSGIERSLGEKDESLIIDFLAAVRAPVDRPAPVLQ
jgi:phosphoribosylanthranilate isomerase